MLITKKFKGFFEKMWLLFKCMPAAYHDRIANPSWYCFSDDQHPKKRVIHYEGELPREVSIEDKTVLERIKLLEQLDDEDKQAIFRIIDGMLTKAKFKDFFEKNVAAL